VLNSAPQHISDRPLPGWIGPDLIAATRATWEPIYQRGLTDDEIIEILLNVGNLFRLFRDSCTSKTKAASGSAAESTPPHSAGPEPAKRTHNGDQQWTTKEKRRCP
jgi:hypothetical protein